MMQGSGLTFKINAFPKDILIQKGKLRIETDQRVSIDTPEL